jgi:hypothetical protein
VLPADYLDFVPTNSTAGHAKPWAGKRQPKPLMTYYRTRPGRPLLHPPAETAPHPWAISQQWLPFRQNGVVVVVRRRVILFFEAVQQSSADDRVGPLPLAAGRPRPLRLGRHMCHLAAAEAGSRQDTGRRTVRGMRADVV